MEAIRAPRYGGFHTYENAIATVINVADQYHFIQGLCNITPASGWTFAAGSLGGGDITTAAAGAAININDATHGLVSGDIVTVQSANHSGLAVVTYVDDDNFTVPIAYVGDETGYWQQGDRLIAGVGVAGPYFFAYSGTLTSAGTNKNYALELAHNTTMIDYSPSEREVGTPGDLGNMGCPGIIIIADGDIIQLMVKGTDDASNCTVRHCNVSVMRG